MQRIFIDNHDRILYYSNPAGYIAGKEAVVDTMFQTQELERFLQKQSLTIRWEDGVYDRLLLGQRGGRFDPEAPPLKSCRVWQLTRDSPINMRFIPYEALLERFGQPDRKHYETVYDGLVGTNDPEEIYTLFRDPVPGYDGRPIGISDVLELYDADGSEFYYGWIEGIGDQRLVRVLKRLSISEKELLTKYCIEDKTQQEIAAEMGLSQRAVGKQLQQLKNFFRKF